MYSRLLALAAAIVVLPWAAQAQSWQDEWRAVQERAKTQTLAVTHQANDAIPLVFAEFTKKTGIKVELTVSRPSSTFARMQTEQRSGQFVWDMWWGGTSTMVNNAVPVGALAKIEDYFILPDVKDPATWRHPDFIFGDAGRHVFTDINEINFALLRNEKVLPDVKVETADDLLNPKLKGRISSRDASTPNFGTFAFATLYHQKGGAFLAKLLKEQDVKVYENPQQLETAINRGGQAVSIGLELSLWDQCRKDGGCKDVEQLKQFPVAISWGISVPKNPPHADAVKVWVNWFMSKEGQEAKLRSWPLHNLTGSLSMRKDVPPSPGHEQYLPDFSRADQYLFVSSEKGSREIAETVKIFKEVTGR